MQLATTWMDLEGIMLNEINQTEKDKCHMISLLCRIKKNKTTQKQTHISKQNKLRVVKGEVKGWELKKKQFYGKKNLIGIKVLILFPRLPYYELVHNVNVRMSKPVKNFCEFI